MPLQSRAAPRLIDEFVQERDQGGDTGRRRAPDDLIVDVAILVSKDVPHPNDLVEIENPVGRVRIIPAESVQRFAKNLQLTLDRRTDDKVEGEVSLGLATSELMDEPGRLGRIPKMRTCLRQPKDLARSRRLPP